MKKKKGDIKAAIFDIYWCKHCNVIHTPGLTREKQVEEPGGRGSIGMGFRATTEAERDIS